MPSQPIQVVTHQPKIRANIHDLHRAVIFGNVDDIKEILDFGTMDLNNTVCGSTVLSLALYKEKDDIFKLLLDCKCTKKSLDINKLSKDDKNRLEPPLLTACRLGNHYAVRLLIQHGINIEAVDNFNHTAVWMATRQRYTDLVAFLLKSGASASPSKLWTHAPLYFAIRYSSKRTEIAKLLIRSGASIHIRKAKTSILYCAILEGNINIAKLIVEAGYPVSSDVEIRENLENGMLTRNHNLLKWLAQELRNPPSLQRQCRLLIRTTVAESNNCRHFLKRLAQLPLPKSVVSYLSLNDNVTY